MHRQRVGDVLSAAGMTLEDVDLLVAHQANIRIIEAAADALGIERRKVFTNLDRVPGVLALIFTSAF